MFNKLESDWDIDNTMRNFTTPLICKSVIPTDFLSIIKRAAAELADAQCRKINVNLAEYDRMVTTDENKPSVSFMEEHINPKINNYFGIYDFKPMNKRHYLKTTRGGKSYRRRE